LNILFKIAAIIVFICRKLREERPPETIPEAGVYLIKLFSCGMNEPENDQLTRVVDLNAKLMSSAASNYAYNKINNILLMQVLAKVENRDMEEIRANVERYIDQFADEFMKKNA
jgi:hypothetical protein